MKYLSLLLMILFISCSKTNNNGKDIVLQKNNLLEYGIYANAISDDNYPYKSTIISIIETSQYGMTMIIGNLNEYSLNQDGSPRLGNHPNPDFMINSASFDVIKHGNGVKFNFIASSCDNITTNPFHNIIPNESDSFYQFNNQLIIKLDNNMTTLEKMKEEDFNKLMSIKKIVYCNGESSND